MKQSSLLNPSNPNCFIMFPVHSRSIYWLLEFIWNQWFLQAQAWFLPFKPSFSTIWIFATSTRYFSNQISIQISQTWMMGKSIFDGKKYVFFLVGFPWFSLKPIHWKSPIFHHLPSPPGPGPSRAAEWPPAPLRSRPRGRGARGPCRLRCRGRDDPRCPWWPWESSRWSRFSSYFHGFYGSSWILLGFGFSWTLRWKSRPFSLSI